MHRSIGICTLFVLLAISFPAAADPGNSFAREIMQKVEARDEGDNQTAEMEMILIDKNSKKRVQRIVAFAKDKGPDSYRVMFFIYPADVRNSAFLTYDYDSPDKDDDQWLYLPALRKCKRIANSDKSGSFMGSDLNYSDMTHRNLDDYDFFLRKEMMVRDHKTWLIEAVPRKQRTVEETGYAKSLMFVRQDNFVIVRAVNWEKDVGFMKLIEVSKLENIEGIWVSTEVHITRKHNQKTVHQTVLRLHNVHFNQDLDYDFFTTRRLEKGM